MSTKSRQAKYVRRLKRRYPPYAISFDPNVKTHMLTEREFDALYPMTKTAQKEFLNELLRRQSEQLQQMVKDFIQNGFVQ